MKKLLSILLVVSVLLASAACSNSGSRSGSNSKTDKKETNVTITIPADLVGETTQEELNESAKKLGYKVTLNDDGSATYVMTKSQRDKMLASLSENINDSFTKMIGSDTTPNITDIKANEDFTVFTVTTKSTEVSLTESFSVMAFYASGGLYNMFAGNEVDNIRVDFVNAASGKVIRSTNSSDMK